MRKSRFDFDLLASLLITHHALRITHYDLGLAGRTFLNIPLRLYQGRLRYQFLASRDLLLKFLKREEGRRAHQKTYPKEK